MTSDAAVAGSAPKKAKPRWKRLAFLTFPSLIMALMIFEVAGRWVLPTSYLEDLPPKAIVPATKPLKPDSSASQDGVTVDGKKLTLGDLSGILKEDDVLGYVPDQNATSVHGWWQSNNVGARSRMDTVREKPAGRKRVLVFGESFGQSSRVRQEEGWSERLGEKRGDLEIINFAVDGYGMGQSLLRFLRVRRQLEYDVVVFMLVPRQDLWRDINVVRFLGEGWKSYNPMPRYVLDGSTIRLVKSPYQSADEYYAENIPQPNETTQSHLRSYDRFYFPLLYELPPLVGNLLAYKTFALWYGRRQYEKLRANSYADAHSEAVNLDRGIFLAAKKQAQDDHAEFCLVLLPTTRDLDAIRRLSRYHPRWNEIAQSMRQAGLKVVDLLPDFLKLKEGDLDTGYDGSHYGPKADALIAQMLAGKI
jgi:hypothetical protein